MPAVTSSRKLALIETGAMATLGFGLLWGRAHPAASRAADDRRAATRHHHDEAFVDRDRDTKLEHQLRADSVKRAVSTD